MEKLLICAFFTFSISAFSQQTRKVLFLGNSYTATNNLPQIVSDLATSTGDILIYDSNLPGGSTLLDHSSNSTSQNKILSNDWDYVVLQEQSQTPAFPVPQAFMDGFSNLKSYISQNKPCAQITSFMTWGHQNGDIQNCPNNPGVCSYTSMQNALAERYMSMSNLFDSEVTAVGEVWRYIKENHPEINLYQSDGSHPSVAGSYLAACSFYTSIFRKDPTLITNNYGLDPSIATLIRNTTKNIIFDQMLNWYIGTYVPNSYFTFHIGNGNNQVIITTNEPTYRNSFIWDFGDGTTSTELIPAHNYATDGTYIIKLTSNKCYLGQNLQSVFERIVNFCSHTNTIFPNNLILCPNETDTIWTQPADSFQWLDFYGNPIAGETNQSIQVPSGHYSVLTTINGCSEISTQVMVDEWLLGPDGGPCTLNTIDFNKDFSVTIFPNPTQNILNIKTDELIKEVVIYNVLGKEVTTNQNSSSAIDVSNLAQGIYIVKIIAENDKIVSSKFVKK